MRLRIMSKMSLVGHENQPKASKKAPEDAHALKQVATWSSCSSKTFWVFHDVKKNRFWGQKWEVSIFEPEIG